MPRSSMPKNMRRCGLRRLRCRSLVPTKNERAVCYGTYLLSKAIPSWLAARYASACYCSRIMELEKAILAVTARCSLVTTTLPNDNLPKDDLHQGDLPNEDRLTFEILLFELFSDSSEATRDQRARIHRTKGLYLRHNILVVPTLNQSAINAAVFLALMKSHARH